MAKRTQLIAAREARGLTRPELAKLLGVQYGFIWRVECGHGDPTLALARLWAQTLNASLDVFKPPQTKPSWVLAREAALRARRAKPAAPSTEAAE